jgi:hypothetical protein
MRVQTLAVSIILSLSAMTAHASPVEWTLANVVFDTGYTATGTFTYDADLSIYSDVNISILLSPFPSILTFSDTDPLFSLSSSQLPQIVQLKLTDNTDPQTYFSFQQLQLNFDSPLTDSGGTISLADSSSLYRRFEVQIDEDFRQIDETTNFLVSGTVSAIPIPAAVWLFASALAGLGWLRRRQTA